MRKYIVKRLLLALLVIWGVLTITFVLSHVVPGDPVQMWVGPRANKAQMEAARKKLGLDKPLVIQYVVYMKKLVSGDLGVSIRTRQRVLEELLRRYSATLELMVVALSFTIVVGISLGVISATRKDSIFDHIIRTVSISGVAMPVFWLGMILQLIFFSKFNLLPLHGRISSDIILFNPIETITGFYLIDSFITGNWPAFWSALKHIILPAFTLAYASLATITRISRSLMLEVLNEDFVRTAKAYGVSQKVINYKYALKNALLPTITVIGLVVGFSMGGTFLIESIFDWPGIGGFAVFSILSKDFPSVMGVTIFFASGFILVNLLVDLTYFIIDPRIKAPGAQE